MSDALILSAAIDSTDYLIPLGIEVWLNDDCLLDIAHITNSIALTHTFPETGGNHRLRFIIKNKLPEHTTVDADGGIIKDAYVSINNIKIDDFDITEVFTKHSVYTHNFNGTQPVVQDRFYKHCGCNGSVEFAFEAPFYLWLLENI